MCCRRCSRKQPPRSTSSSPHERGRIRQHRRQNDRRSATTSALRPRRPGRFGALVGAEQIERVKLKPAGESLEGAKGQVAFASLETAEIGAVHAQHDRELLLRETSLQANLAQVSPNGPLQVAFHTSNRAALLLDGLQTYE